MIALSHGMSALSRLRTVFVNLGFSAIFFTFAGCTMSPIITGDNVGVSTRDGGTLYGSYLAGGFAGASRDTKSAANYYLKALQKDPDNGVILERAFLLSLADGQVDKAADLAERIVDRDSGNRIARLTLALDAFKAKDFEAARTNLQKGRKGPISIALQDLITAWSFAGQGEPDKAVLTLDGGKTSSFKVFYLTNRAYLNDFLDETQAADNDYVNVLQTTRWRSRRLIRAYGSFLERNGRVDEARKIYEDYVELSPRDKIMKAELARLSKGKLPDPYLKSPNEAVANALFGPATYLVQERNVDLPIIYLQLALNLDKDFDDARLLLGDLFESSGGWEDASHVFAGVSKSSPFYREAQLQLAINMDRLDRTDEAVRVLKRLAQKYPDDYEILKTHGDVLRMRERYDDSLGVYSKAMKTVDEVGPEHWSLFYARGVAYERTNQWALAEADFLKAIDLSPEQPLTLNYLGYSWIDQGINYAEAIDMIRKAVELSPGDGYIIDSLGWAFYRQGKYDKAVKYLEQAVQLQPSDPVINEHLGDAYWKVGRLLEARFQWRQALDLKPEEKDVPAIERKLDAGLDAASEKNAT